MRFFILFLICSAIFCEEVANPLPKDASVIMKAYNESIEKLHKECIQKLTKVQIDVTKSGNLDGALTIKNQIEKLKSEMNIASVDVFGQEVAKEVSPIVGKWMINNNNMAWHLYAADGTSKDNGNHTGKWEFKNNKLTVTWSNGNVDTTSLNSKGTILSGSNNRGMSFTLTKMPETK